jgi:hypothetical protein
MIETTPVELRSLQSAKLQLHRAHSLLKQIPEKQDSVEGSREQSAAIKRHLYMAVDTSL